LCAAGRRGRPADGGAADVSTEDDLRERLARAETRKADLERAWRPAHEVDSLRRQLAVTAARASAAPPSEGRVRDGRAALTVTDPLAVAHPRTSELHQVFGPTHVERG